MKINTHRLGRFKALFNNCHFIFLSYLTISLNNFIELNEVHLDMTCFQRDIYQGKR